MSMRPLPLILALSFVVASVAGCLQPGDSQSVPSDAVPKRISHARDPASAEFKPIVVVAVIDTGTNPYHAEFQEQYDISDPATYVPGYPADVVPLQLSAFKQPASTSVADVNHEKADAAIWKATKPRTLYRVEGTKIVGLINFESTPLPGSGHGTMTSSRATGNTISAGGPAVRLVLVKGFTTEAITWASQQPWIDILSISSGGSGNLLVPVTGTLLDGDIMKAYDAASHRKPFFASSGNGVGNAGVLGFPTWTRGASGVPDVISVGANDNGKLSLWHNQQPYIVGDGCGNPSATDNTADKIANTGGGTSSATPFSAGTAAKILLEARRLLGDPHVGTRDSAQPIKSFSAWKSGYDGDAKIILAQGNATGITKGPLADGVLTLEEFKDVIYHTARWDGSEDKSDGNACTGPAMGTVPPADLPRDLVAQFQGYGEVNGLTAELAAKVLRGESDNPSRASDDAWYERFHMMREQTMPA